MNILDAWKERGYQFEEGLNMPAGKIKINNRTLCFYSEHEPTTGQTMARWTMQTFLGRRLKGVEIVRFKTHDHTDLRISNLKLRSKLSSAKENYLVNGPPVLGYSHCACECGEALDVLKQGDQPHAFVMGHSPADKRRSGVLEAAVNGKDIKKKRNRKPKVKDPRDPKHWIFTKEGERMKVDPVAGPLLAMMSDPLYQYRPLFEKMIHDLPWEKFKIVLNGLLQMESLEVQSCPTEFVKG